MIWEVRGYSDIGGRKRCVSCVSFRNHDEAMRFFSRNKDKQKECGIILSLKRKEIR